MFINFNHASKHLFIHPRPSSSTSFSQKKEDFTTQQKGKPQTTNHKRYMIMNSSDTPPDRTMILKSLPIRLTSVVVPGFGRGSKDLGIPTANVCKTKLKCKMSFDSLPTGIYWGFARIIEKVEGGESGENGSSYSTMNGVYKTAVSIGYNPVYGNDDKTIEPHLIAYPEDPARKKTKCGETEFQDFYGSDIRLSIVGYLRPELPFEGLDKLIDAIKNDIVQTERLAEGKDSSTVEEKNWVESNEEEL
jgi:riboflavin kinase